MSYQPFLIAPYKTGLDEDLEIWQLPKDAFAELENANVKHGYIQKRNGYVLLGEMVHGREITVASNGTPAVFTVLSAAGLANDQTISLHYMAGGTWDTLNGQKFTIQNLVGLTFELVDAAGAVVDGAALGAYTASSGRLGTYPGLRIMAIFKYISSDNTRVTLISDTRRVAVYNTTLQCFEPLDLYNGATATTYTDADCWTSGNIDYLWHCNWQSSGSINRVYFTNGLSVSGAAPGTDGIWFYDNTSHRIQLFRPVINGLTTINGCKLIFVIKQRLLLLHTIEGANTFPQKARWCQVQSPSGATSWDDNVAGRGGFVECPTGDQIISARDLQESLIAQFTNSVWSFRPIPDPALPFRWDKLNNFRAADAKMGTTEFDKYVFSIGQRGITATDGGDTQRIDDRIQDFTSNEINQDQFEKVFIERDFSELKTWILYPNENNDECENALIFDEESKSWSIYTFDRQSAGVVVDMNVFGYGTAAKDYSASDFTAVNGLDIAAEDADEQATCLSYSWSKNTELFLGGNRIGQIMIMEEGNSDLGQAISFKVTSAGWNPYQDQGKEAQLGYVDIYFDSDKDTNLTVQFFKNDNEFPYSEIGIDLLPNLRMMADVVDITINADPSTGFTISSPHHGVNASEQFYIYGVDNAIYFNDYQWQASSVTENTIVIDDDITKFGVAISGISQANPAVVDAVGHNLTEGQKVILLDVGGMTEINGIEAFISNVTDDTFEMTNVDSTAFTPYSGGGYAFLSYVQGGTLNKDKFYRTKMWKRVFAGGIGYLHQIRIFNDGNTRPLRIHAFKPWFRMRGRRVLG